MERTLSCISADEERPTVYVEFDPVTARATSSTVVNLDSVSVDGTGAHKGTTSGSTGAAKDVVSELDFSIAFAEEEGACSRSQL